MVTYVRVRNIRPGHFQGAIKFLKEYKTFIDAELGADVHFGTEFGRIGTVVASSRFENMQALEDALNKLRENSNYVGFIDESAQHFEDEITEHLIMDMPV